MNIEHFDILCVKLSSTNTLKFVLEQTTFSLNRCRPGTTSLLIRTHYEFSDVLFLYQAIAISQFNVKFVQESSFERLNRNVIETLSSWKCGETIIPHIKSVFNPTNFSLIYTLITYDNRNEAFQEMVRYNLKIHYKEIDNCITIFEMLHLVIWLFTDYTTYTRNKMSSTYIRSWITVWN